MFLAKWHAKLSLDGKVTQCSVAGGETSCQCWASEFMNTVGKGGASALCCINVLWYMHFP